VQPSLVEQIEGVLQRINEQLAPNVQVVPSVQAWIDACNDSTTGSRGLDWSAVPAAVDSGSTAMGLSTAKSEKKRAKKLLKLDMDKVNARVLRKRQQVGASGSAELLPSLAGIFQNSNSCSRGSNMDGMTTAAVCVI
jgi:hypothetical protein